MFDKLTASTIRIFLISHATAWLLTTAVWYSAWASNQEPGPRFNFATRFIQRIDVLAYRVAEDASFEIARLYTTWSGGDLELWYVITYSVLILIGGSIQWLVLGQFVGWTRQRLGPKFGFVLLIAGCLWFLGGLTLWMNSGTVFGELPPVEHTTDAM